MRIVDLDDARTWPAEVREATRRLAERLIDTTEYSSDLRIDPDEEDRFRLGLRGSLLKVYHATRLLDHEVDNIRQDGMTPASRQLVESRIQAAFENGYMTESVKNDLLARNLFGAGDEVSNREGNVCFFGGRQVMIEDVAGIWRPMATWGGEIIYFGSGMADETKEQLKILGRPAIVVAGVDASEGWRTHLGSIANAFVGKKLGLHDTDFDLFYRGHVPGEQILAIWMPGDPEYDRYPELPDS